MIQQTYHNIDFPLIVFDIYLRPNPRTLIHKLTINNFMSFLCFVKVDNKLFASTLSTLMVKDYVEVAFQIRIVKDNCKAKYAPEHQVMDIDVPAVVGPRSRVMLLKRTGLTHADNKVVKI